MRVTQSMISGNMLRNLSNSYSRLDTYMDQLSTGKKVNRPSDDPVVAMKGMNYRTRVQNVEQYQRNISEVHTWMDNSDAALDEATKALHRLRELAVQGSNGTYEENQRKSLANEVDQLKGHLVEIANAKVNNKYIFNGTNTTEEPVTVDGAGNVTSISTNNSSVMIEVSSGSTLKANANPLKAFGESDTNNIFKDIEFLSQALKDNDQAKIEQSLSKIDTRMNEVVNERTSLGARMNRLDLIESRVADQEIMATQLMSNNEDADMEKVIMNLTSQESVHRAALSAGSRVIQPTLLDFLR